MKKIITCLLILVILCGVFTGCSEEVINDDIDGVKDNFTENSSDSENDEAIDGDENAVIDLSTLLNLDVFDWQLATDEEKLNIINQIISVWEANGDVNDNGIDADELLADVEAAIFSTDQANVFETACQVGGIDASRYFE
ncbi:MAG: hypothetical protein K0S55_1906 [Clostridia bacterium]|jgi:hypothetical protein|nr:hypothetical protein [Clostridia bacterium]